MKKYALEYPLNAGFIDHWLVTDIGRKECKVKIQDNESAVDFRRRVLQEAAPDVLPYTTPPVELDQISLGYWLAAHCGDDHLLEKSVVAPTWQRLERWAYVNLVMPGAGSVMVELAASCAAGLWCNGALVHRAGAVQSLERQGHSHQSFEMRLKRGSNHVYLQLEEAALGNALLSAALRLSGPKAEAAVIHLPVYNEETQLRKSVEATYQIANLSQAVYTYEDRFTLNCANRIAGSTTGVVRLQDEQGGIRAETFTDIEPGAKIESIMSYQLPAGAMEAVLMPVPETYYNLKLHAERVIPFTNAPFKYSVNSEEDGEARLMMLLQEGARAGGVFGELTKMMLGWWEVIDRQEMEEALQRVQQRAGGSLIDLLGLISMMIRQGGHAKFPADLKPKIQAAITGFPYHPEKVFRPLALNETQRLLLAACQTMAGQKYPREHFAVSGRTGAKERKQGEETLLSLLRQAGQFGWREGHSHLDQRIAALAHLADLAKDETVAELAAVLLDQSAFTLAQYSFQGVFGAPQLEMPAGDVKTARLAATTAINHFLFGPGCYNKQLTGALSLAFASEYSLPDLVHAIALEQPTAAWTLEHSARPEEGWSANQVTYKTTDYLLSSLQDYQPGGWGGQVHPWQATLGSEAIVFTNHPAALQQSAQRQAGKWRGSASLPRIAQWQDTLVCLYQLPQDDRLGFTHAYFPTFAFDEFRLEDGWAFARKGDGYLALYASSGLHLVDSGDDAHFELRAAGPQVAWVVQMGRRGLDGDFTDFCHKVQAKPLSVEGLSVEWQTLRGDLLQFAWEGELRRNGDIQPLQFEKRFEGPFVDAAFPAETMDIGHGEQMMRLSFI